MIKLFELTAEEFKNLYNLYFEAIRNYIYYRSKNYTLEKSLSLGIAMGIMHVKSKKNAKINFKSIKNIINKIKINKENKIIL